MYYSAKQINLLVGDLQSHYEQSIYYPLSKELKKLVDILNNACQNYKAFGDTVIFNSPSAEIKFVTILTIFAEIVKIESEHSAYNALRVYADLLASLEKL